MTDYERVSQICTSNGRNQRYRGIFSQGYQDLKEANAHFASAFGDSYAYLNPTVHAVAKAAAESVFAGPELGARRDICVSAAFSSAMSIDEIAQSCVFALMEGFCPDDAEEDQSFAFEIESVNFKLPKIRWAYDVSPPPPPPLTMAAYTRLVQEDPEGFVEVRRQLEDWFPKLSAVATSSIGASVGPYIAEFDVTPMQITRAFMASLHMTPDSLGARVIESKHTGCAHATQT